MASGRRAAQGRHLARHVHHERGLVPLPPVRGRGEERGVRLDQEPVLRHLPGDLLDHLRPREGDDPREGDQEAQVERAPRELQAAGEAVDHPAGLAGTLLLEDVGRLAVRLARVHDDRQAHVAGQPDLPAEGLALRLSRRVVVVEVEADLADRHDPALAGQAPQLVVDAPRRRSAPRAGGRPRWRAGRSEAAISRARRCPALSSTPPTTSISTSPAPRARATTSSRSASNCGMSMWQWESTRVTWRSSPPLRASSLTASQPLRVIASGSHSTIRFSR